jgi:outer membrane protein TolC
MTTRLLPLTPIELRAGALHRLLLWLAAAVLAGCAGVSPDAGFSKVQQTARSQLRKDLLMASADSDHERIAARVAEPLSRPLSADDTVQLALLNNRGLQADLQDLTIGDAERAHAGRLPNPGFSFSRLSRGEEREIERGLHLSLARLLALPWIQELEARRFEQTQAEVAMAVLTLAADTRKAWSRTVAAEEGVRYQREVMAAAVASAEPARRMAAVGNFSKLERAREQGFYADAALDLARALQARQASRERLIRLLGLWGGQTDIVLPERLPGLPAEAAVQAARLHAAQTAKNLGLTRATGGINVLELGAVRNGSNEAPTQRGWEISLELPLFDAGDARSARAEAVYRRALHRAAATAIDARSEVHGAHANYRSAWDIARHHRDEIVPLHQQVADESLLRYNGMRIGVFGLLADARVQLASVNAAIEALRDFWLAQADLDMALIGKPGQSAPGVPGPAAASAAPAH